MRHIHRAGTIGRLKKQQRELRRGRIAQRRRRGAERVARRTAVVYARLAIRGGSLQEEAARDLGISGRAMSRWMATWKKDRMQVRVLGRRTKWSAREKRNEIVAYLLREGAGTGLPVLRAQYPEVARSELIELQRRLRRIVRIRHRRAAFTLRWTRPGTVWAMDHETPPCAIDGKWPRLLLDRDLASSLQIGALPVAAEDAEGVVRALESHFRWHGTPLVMKNDNGPAFRAQMTKDLFRRHGVLQLFSPPRTPQYNGACEAGVGSIATRAHHHAAFCNRPGQWTADDVEAARRQANETARPWGWQGPTPLESWEGRTEIGEEERNLFQATYEAYVQQERCVRQIDPEAALDHWQQASIDRVAISRALVKHGYLEFRRRRVAPPIIRNKAVIIS